jgi:hypothetical protein
LNDSYRRPSRAPNPTAKSSVDDEISDADHSRNVLSQRSTTKDKHSVDTSVSFIASASYRNRDVRGGWCEVIRPYLSFPWAASLYALAGEKSKRVFGTLTMHNESFCGFAPLSRALHAPIVVLTEGGGAISGTIRPKILLSYYGHASPALQRERYVIERGHG